jgi:hypothetical protein
MPTRENRKHPLLLLVLAGTLTACAANDAAVERAPASENEYVTGSRIPGKGRGTTTTMSKEEMERIRSTTQQGLPENMKP